MMAENDIKVYLEAIILATIIESVLKFLPLYLYLASEKIALLFPFYC